MDWYKALDKEFIDSWEKLKFDFIERFMISARLKKGSRHLISIKQGENESLWSFFYLVSMKN